MGSTFWEVSGAPSLSPQELPQGSPRILPKIFPTNNNFLI